MTLHTMPEVVQYFLDHKSSYAFIVERKGNEFLVLEKKERVDIWREVE